MTIVEHMDYGQHALLYAEVELNQEVVLVTTLYHQMEDDHVQDLPQKSGSIIVLGNC